MQYEKMGTGLALVLESFNRGGPQELTRFARTLGVVSAVDSPKPARTVVFIHCDENADLSGVAAYGVRVNQTRGTLRTAIAPITSLDQLSEEPAIQRITQSRCLRPLMDVAPGKVHVPAFRAANPGVDGSSVIVGVVDAGIDPNHPAFAGRILRIWDQVIPGPGVAEGGYGLELAGPVLTASRDTEGHGTHVSGIAAGANATFGGIAPGAHIVMVKSDLQDAHIADGIRYIFRVAREMGQPAVINLSLGGHFDAHDGTDALSRIIDSESGEGRIVCCAAGNEGDDNIHAQANIAAGATRSLRFKAPASAGPEAVVEALLNGWYARGDTFEVAVQSPAGYRTPFQPVIAAGNPTRTYQLPDARVQIVTPGPSPVNGDHQFLVDLAHPSNPSLPLAAGIWRLWLRGTTVTNGRVDVWALDGHPQPQVTFTGTSVQDGVKVGAPGCASAAVTVASYTTKVQWTDIDGQAEQVGLALDTISSFSSEGPLRNNAQKPDVAAPGAMICATLSADSTVRRAEEVTPQFRIMAGTSMATPFISGLVALLLQRDKTLTPAGVKTLLRARSTIPGKPPGAFDTKWGFGLIDATGL